MQVSRIACAFAALGLAGAALAEAPRAALRHFPLLQEAAGLPAAGLPGEADLDPAFLAETVAFLADDDKKGRKPGSPELEQVVFDHMIELLSSWGLQPAGDGGTSYKQYFKASSWWPMRGEPEPAAFAHDDHAELFCGKPNQHGFAAKPDGTPVSVEIPELLGILGRAGAEGLKADVLRASYDTHNIAAMVPGTDLAEEVLVLGAHIDHVGHRGSTIYNGADDNASGSTILLSIARAFARAREAGNGPRRSVLFLWFSAEEMGLLGSQYWVKQPTIELGRVKSMLNMDMLGRTERDEISVYDGHTHGQDWVFHDWHDVDSLGFADVHHDLKSFLRRSDQYPFYRKGIPVMFFFEGFQGESHSQMNPDYHRPGDTPDKIDVEKLHASARFIYRHAYRAAREALPPMHAGE